MFNLLKKRIKNEKGLSLVELLAVIVILGIIAAIAIPAIGNIISNSRDKAQISDALSIISGGKLAHIETGCGKKEDGCTGKVLADYVDGGELDEVAVKLNKDNNWEISGYVFEMNTERYADINGNETQTEPALKAALGEEDDTDTDTDTDTNTNTP